MEKGKGKVYLVGAGPGDPRLITVRGQECIRACDVVVYDRLASPRLLKFLKPGAEKVYVGKLPDRHTMKQEEINQLLVDLALQGKTVTRLKGHQLRPLLVKRIGKRDYGRTQQQIDPLSADHECIVRDMEAGQDQYDDKGCRNDRH